MHPTHPSLTVTPNCEAAITPPTPPDQDWERAKTILCVRLDSLGDILMTTPAFHALKTTTTDRHLVLLTSPAGAEVAALIPEIDEVIVYEAPWMKSTAAHRESYFDFEMITFLQERSFDAAVIFTAFSQSPLPAAFLCYLANIPLRLAHCHENPYQLLTHWILDPEPSTGIRHEVQRQLDLVATLGYSAVRETLSLTIPQSAQENLWQILQSTGIDLNQPWIVLHPGATAPSRRYAPEGFTEISRCLIRQGYQIIFVGKHLEYDLIHWIQNQLTSASCSLVDCLTLGELAALLKVSALLISNNSGPVHLAAAVGTPVVDLYALTNPQHTPWQVPHRVLFHDVPCKFCYKSICPEGHHHCLSLVTPDQVMAAVSELLHRQGRHHVSQSKDEPSLANSPSTFYPSLTTSSMSQSAKQIWR